jgi:Gas vesicle synthesis protein GvpL/GvpF
MAPASKTSKSSLVTTIDKLRQSPKQHLYVYAVVERRPSARKVARLPSMPHGDAPRIVALDDDVSVIVADVPASTYAAAALEARLGDLDWVAKCGAAHHSVADVLADSYVVLPFRLFTIFSTEQKALTTLRKARPRIRRALARVKGRKEWVLRIGRPARLQAGLPTDARHKNTERAKVGTDFLRAKADARKQEAERAARVKNDAVAVFETLRELADESTLRPVEPGTNLLVDAAFLVGTGRTSRFQQALKRAAAGLLRDGCQVSLTGPWPPYSFASVDDKRHG